MGDANPPNAPTESEALAKKSIDTTASPGLGLSKRQSKSGLDCYGTCTEADAMIAEEHLSPLKVFIKSWAKVAGVLGPLVVIITLNFMNPTALSMKCETHHSTGVSLVCAVTLPGVRFFPRVGIILSVFMVSWRMAHERAYYVLMKHKIMLDLDCGKRFGFWVCVTLFFLFGVACSHFTLKFCYGHPCSAPDVCDPNSYLLKTTLLEALKNPAGIDPNAQEYLNTAIFKFIVPGIITLVCLFGLLNLESEFMPLSKMLELRPRKVYHSLGEFVFVPEHTMRNMMNYDSVISAALSSEHTFADASKVCFEVAHKRGCNVLGAISDLEDASPTEQAGEDEELSKTPLFERLGELWHIDWWPLKLLMNPKLTDKASVDFRRIMGFQFCIVLVAIIAMQVLTILRLCTYGKLLIDDLGANKVVSIPEMALCFEMSSQIVWIMQVQKYVRGFVVDISGPRDNDAPNES